MKKTLKYLSIIGGFLGAIASLDVIPLIPQNIGMVIIGISASLSALITKVGDFIDDGKMNDSFKI